MEDDKKVRRQPCEVYSRVVGYLRPVDSWNAGKQSEYDDRKPFRAVSSEI
ncbi:MAG: anaerobic ribonucleoside-triphosphate reductase [Patescibacteria group bacterium]